MRIQILGTLLTLPLGSCSRVVAHANMTPEEGVSVRVEHAALEDVPVEIVAVGNVEANESVEVKSRVGGQIRSLAFVEGQNVTKGQLLFSVDRDPMNRELAQQQAELDRDIAMEQQAAAVAARDAASERQRHLEAGTATKLGEMGVLSGQAVSQAVSTSESAHAGVQADQAAMAAAAGAVKADRARIAQTLLRLSFADVVAPISGRVGIATVKEGSVVRENDTTLITILQIAPVRVAFGIPEQSLAEVRRLNAQGALEVEARTGNGILVKGRLDFIDNTVDPATGTIRLKATFANRNSELWPGEFVQVRLRLRIENGKVMIPESAVQEGVDGKYTWKVDSNVATMMPVTVERSYHLQNSDGRITSLAVLGGKGPRPGDAVVTHGQLRLTPGVRVAEIADKR